MKGGSVMPSRNRGLQKLAGILEIPQDIVLDLPRITMLGNKQILIENHKGIIEYTPSLVRIKVSQGELIINGNNLSLSNLQIEQILVEGTVRDVVYDI
jgi:sporulation protein YqfC